MRFTVTLLLLVGVSLPIFCQSTPYEAFEVDSAAHPKGGMGTLALFVKTNLRPPIAAKAAGLQGKIYVQGIVKSRRPDERSGRSARPGSRL